MRHDIADDRKQHLKPWFQDLLISARYQHQIWSTHSHSMSDCYSTPPTTLTNYSSLLQQIDIQPKKNFRKALSLTQLCIKNEQLFWSFVFFKSERRQFDQAPESPWLQTTTSTSNLIIMTWSHCRILISKLASSFDSRCQASLSQ